MAKIILFNKPFNVLSQFTDGDGRKTLADYIRTQEVYPAGRLDRDSEGLLLLTDDGRVQHLISHPKHKLDKTYWVQVEGEVNQDACEKLLSGVSLKDGPAKAKFARVIDEPDIWERDPPIRQRQSIPTSWLELIIDEGRNRQVRRMTAAIGFPTLRLVRYAIGDWNIDKIPNGEWREQTLSASLEKELDSSKWQQARKMKPFKPKQGPQARRK